MRGMERELILCLCPGFTDACGLPSGTQAFDLECSLASVWPCLRMERASWQSASPGLKSDQYCRVRIFCRKSSLRTVWFV